MKKTTFPFYLLLLFITLSCSNKAETLDLIPVKLNAYYGYVDKLGKTIIEPNYSYTTPFINDFTIIKDKNENYQYLTKKGVNLFNKKFAHATVFSENVAIVCSRNESPKVITKEGIVKFTLDSVIHTKIFKEDKLAFSINDSIGEKWGFVDSEGHKIIQPSFDSTKNFSNNKCAVENEYNEWGYIDKTGKLIIAYNYDFAGDFINEKAVVKNKWDTKYKVITTDESTFLEAKYDSIIQVQDDYLVKLDSKWGWLNAKGESQIALQFEEAFPFSSGLALVKKEGKYHYINTEGKPITTYTYDFATPFKDNVAFAIFNKKSGFIDIKGAFIFEVKKENLPKSLLQYFYNIPFYNSVETDFFDMKSVIKAIHLDNPEGINFGDKDSDHINKLYTKKIILNNTANPIDLTLIKNKKITNEATLSLYAIKDLYFNDDYIINENQKDNLIKGFWYKISLNGRSFYKSGDLKRAFIKQLKGYQEIKNSKTFINSSLQIFKNSKHFLLIHGGNFTNECTIEIIKNNGTLDIDSYNSRLYGNYQVTDTDFLDNNSNF